MNTAASDDPFSTLGLPAGASEAEVRARYLELVKQFPPERDPDRFREVRLAYEAVKDPLVIARRLIRAPDDEAPRWAEAIEEQKRILPPLTPAFLLSLGNREPLDQRRSTASQPDSVSGSPVNGAE